jgi:hypothetical protein
MNPNEGTTPPALEAQINKKKMFLMIAAGLAGYAVLYFSLSLIPLVVTGVVLVFVIGYLLKEALTNSTRVVIDEKGVMDSRMGMGTIRWNDITDVYVAELNNIDIVCLEVADDQKYLNRRSGAAAASLKFSKALNNVSPFNINTGVLDAGADEIYSAIVAGREYYSKPDRDTLRA